MISYGIDLIFHFYGLLILICLLCSWVPNIDWNSQPFSAMRSVTEPYLKIFRAFIPPVGMIDFSPIVALILLSIVQSLIVSALRGAGL